MLIEDSRSNKDFKSISFSGYKKSSVVKELSKSIMVKRIEDILYWSSELICSGHFLDLWETIFSVYSQHIHLGNPKLAIYLYTRYNDFKTIVMNGYIDRELLLRDNENIRHIFAEIMYMLCYSRKKYALQFLKISLEEIHLSNITHLFIADTTHYIDNVFSKDDPKELFIPFNELAYNLSKKVNSSHNCSYWLEWILTYEKICKKKKQHLTARLRNHVPVHQSFKTDIIWIVWDIILQQIESYSQTHKKIIDCLYRLYCIRYSTNTKQKRRIIIYCAFLFMCDNVDLSLPINQSTTPFVEIKKGLPKIYQRIKKSENQESTTSSENIQKTSKKLDILNSIS